MKERISKEELEERKNYEVTKAFYETVKAK